MSTRHSQKPTRYGVATCSRLLKIIGLFCKKALWKRRYSSKETYDFKEPDNRSHPLLNVWCGTLWSISNMTSKQSVTSDVLQWDNPSAATHCNTLQHTATQCNHIKHDIEAERDPRDHNSNIQRLGLLRGGSGEKQGRVLQCVAVRCSVLQSGPVRNMGVPHEIRIELTFEFNFSKRGVTH